MFGRRQTKIIEDQKDEQAVIGRIEIKQGHVKAFIVRCLTNKTIYTANYESTKSDIYTYHEAVDELKRYIAREGLQLEGEISCNVPLPFVKNTTKRSR